MAAVAGPDAARRELLARCAELAAHWAAEVAKLSREHEERVQQSLDCVHADRRVAAGVKSLKAQATLEHKYLAQLEKRLGMLQSDRNRPLAFVPKPSDTRSLQKNLPVEKPRLAEPIAEPIPQPPLSLQQVMELELGLENRKIHTIDPAHAAQMFHNWPDEELFDNPAYIRFHEVFGHLRNDSQKASLLAILQAVAEDRQERWSYLEAS